MEPAFTQAGKPHQPVVQRPVCENRNHRMSGIYRFDFLSFLPEKKSTILNILMILASFRNYQI
jgi:hypothetical protein